jgi:carbon-monoxide dehydrogenase small subunit
MSKISITVNGALRHAEVEPRTQLAAVLRDRLHLTGTHLACEQGVCGACTVLVDGKPIRSCITYAHANDGAVIETIEGFQADPIMTALRRAFTENHALQCGFCTPGMIITARDIVLRLDQADEKRIRHELSGNICRCTGYVGIVRAIAEVIGQRLASGACAPHPPAAILPRAPLRPFALSRERAASGVTEAASTLKGVSVQDGWTVVDKRVALEHPAAAVWSLFSDIERVARCIPGAQVESVEGDAFVGSVSIKFGPIKASFLGKGTRRIDAPGSVGVIDAQGGDANGQSNIRGQLTYRLTPGADDRATIVDLRLRFQIKGLLAQFNRPDLVESFVDVLLAQFAAACDATIAGRETAPVRQMNAIALVASVVRQRIRRLFAPSASRR